LRLPPPLHSLSLSLSLSLSFSLSPCLALTRLLLLPPRPSHPHTPTLTPVPSPSLRSDDNADDKQRLADWEALTLLKSQYQAKWGILAPLKSAAQASTRPTEYKVAPWILEFLQQHGHASAASLLEGHSASSGRSVSHSLFLSLPLSVCVSLSISPSLDHTHRLTPFFARSPAISLETSILAAGTDSPAFAVGDTVLAAGALASGTLVSTKLVTDYLSFTVSLPLSVSLMHTLSRSLHTQSFSLLTHLSPLSVSSSLTLCIFPFRLHVMGLTHGNTCKCRGTRFSKDQRDRVCHTSRTISTVKQRFKCRTFSETSEERRVGRRVG
jgi:hypothetical protein